MVDFQAIKQRQQQTWASGDYAIVATQLNIVSELLCEATALRAGQKVLDVATGSGNTALAAARPCRIRKDNRVKRMGRTMRLPDRLGIPGSS